MFSNLNIFLTFDGCRQWWGKDEAGTAEVNNAEILDNDKGNNAFLDVTIDDIDDDAAVCDDADKEDDNNDPALERLGEQEHRTRRPDWLWSKNICRKSIHYSIYCIIILAQNFKNQHWLYILQI